MNRVLIVVMCAIGFPAIAQNVASQSIDPFARYATPGECVAALTRIENEYWRARRPDTTYSGSLGRTPQPQSIARVKQCVSRFNVDKVAERDLLALGYAYLAAHEDGKADAAFRRLIAIKANRPIAEHSWALAQIVNIHTSVSPVRIAKAREYMVKLDALGAPAAAERMIAHLNLAEAARVADSVPLFKEEARAAVRASDEIAVDSVRKQRAFTSAEASIALATWHMRKNDGPSAVKVLEEALSKLPTIRPTVRSVIAKSLSRYALIGKPAPRLQSAQWFNDNANGTHPAAGKVTTVTFASHGCGALCYPGYSVVKRLKGSFEQSLNLVFATRTEGYYRNQIVEPGKEFDLGQRYFLEHLQVPATIAVWQTQFGRKPDGRLDVLIAPNEWVYHPAFIPPLQTYVINKNGIVRFVTNMLPNREFELNNIIKEER